MPSNKLNTLYTKIYKDNTEITTKPTNKNFIVFNIKVFMKHFQYSKK